MMCLYGLMELFRHSLLIESASYLPWKIVQMLLKEYSKSNNHHSIHVSGEMIVVSFIACSIFRGCDTIFDYYQVLKTSYLEQKTHRYYQ